MSENAHAVIVDDEEGNRDGFSRALSKIGWKVRAFTEAEAPSSDQEPSRSTWPNSA